MQYKEAFIQEHYRHLAEVEHNPELILRRDVRTTTGKRLQRSKLIQRIVNGLPYYVFPILDGNIDTGLYIIAWPIY